jgi:hypothetical protein
MLGDRAHLYPKPRAQRFKLGARARARLTSERLRCDRAKLGRTQAEHAFPLAGKVSRGCATDGGAGGAFSGRGAAVTPTPNPAPQGGGETIYPTQVGQKSQRPQAPRKNLSNSARTHVHCPHRLRLEGSRYPVGPDAETERSSVMARGSPPSFAEARRKPKGSSVFRTEASQKPARIRRRQTREHDRGPAVDSAGPHAAGDPRQRSETPPCARPARKRPLGARISAS